VRGARTTVPAAGDVSLGTGPPQRRNEYTEEASCVS
jgi:hypothetical protein